MSVIKLQSPNEEKNHIYYLVDTSIEPLGVGGMGQVFRAIRVQENTGVRTDVAIKFLFDDLPEHAIERARREASIQIHNENLVEMFGFMQIDEVGENGKLYEHYHVVSELLHGVMLYDLLNGKVTDKNGKNIAFAQELYQMYMDNRSAFALMIVKNVLSGIMALHDKGYVHRDLDPSNIMITSDRKIKVIDFGIAKQINSLCTQDKQLTSAGAFIGKASYAAPELVLGDVANQNETTDIYAIGIMLFQLMAGKLPFEGPSHEVLKLHLNGKLPLNEIKDKNIRKIIDKATQKKQVARFQSAAEFRVAIERISSNPAPNPAPGPLPPIIRYKKLILICASVLLLASIGWVILNKHNKEKELLQLQAHEEMVAARRAELKNVILDSNMSNYEIDSLTGCTIKTAALITEEAQLLLQSGNLNKVKEGLEMLDKVIAKNYVSSSDAMRMKSILLYEDATHFTLDLQMLKSGIDSTLLVRDNAQAHELMKRAVGLDSTDYKALYELGCDYFAGPIRTNKEGSRNIPEALNCFYRGLKHAESNNDTEYIEMFKKRIGQLE